MFGAASVNPWGVLLTATPNIGPMSGGFKLADGSVARSVKFEGLFVGNEGGGFVTLPQLVFTTTSPLFSGKVALCKP